MRPRVIVLGDLRVDYTFSLTEEIDSTSDLLRYAPVQIRVGGTAFHFARFGASVLDITVMGKLGMDPNGALLRSHIAETGAASVFFETENHPTGIVVSIIDLSAVGRPRLVFANAPCASDQLIAEEVLSQTTLIESVDALIVDGYRYLFEPSAHAANLACRLARDLGKFTIFDIAPHDLTRRNLPIRLPEIVMSYDLVITELSGAIDLLPGSRAFRREGFATEQACAVAAVGELRRAFPAVASWIIRFGAGNMEEEVISRSIASTVYHRTGYAGIEDKRGFGEQVTCRHVRDILDTQVGR